MKIDHQKLTTAYIETIDKISDSCEEKSHFSVEEIVLIISKLIESGQYYIEPPNSNLYTKQELDAETTKAYNQGYKDGQNHFYGEDCLLNK